MTELNDIRTALIRMTSERDARKRLILMEKVFSYIRRREDEYAVMSVCYEKLVRKLSEAGVTNVILDESEVTEEDLKC